MDGRIRILIVTDSPVLPSGLAETTRLIFSTLLDRHPDQYDLHQVGLCHCYAVTRPRWPIYPTMAAKGPGNELRWMPEDRFGQKTFRKVAARLQPDIVFGFGDPQRVTHLCAPAGSRRHKLVLYVNFDGLPAPAACCSALRHADAVFTKSEFARNVLTAAVSDFPREKAGYLYSPADTKRFAPISAAEKAELRRGLLPPWMKQDGFILGWVGRNQWRKQVWTLYQAIHYLRAGAYLVCERCGRASPFDWDPARQVFAGNGAAGVAGARPGWRGDRCHHCGAREVRPAAPMEDLYLWLHMPRDEPEKDWPLDVLEAQFDVKPGRDIFYTAGCASKAALPPDSMPVLYNLWDALLYLTGGEGFGIPAWEAMCCGLPAIYTNYSSHAEFLGQANAGLPVGGVLQPERETCIWRMIADLPQTIEAVRQLYFERELRAALSNNGRAFAERFAAGNQVERWHEVFQQLTKPNGKPLEPESVGNPGRAG